MRASKTCLRSPAVVRCWELLLVFAVVALLGAKSVAKAPETIEELRTRIEAILHETKTPGVGIALVRKDGPEWIAGIGLADVAEKNPVTADTLFRIGSTTKMFVSLSALKLQEEEKLDLEDTLKSRAPRLEFSNPWEATDPVRIVHLLEHTAGWYDMSVREYAFVSDHGLSLEEGLAVSPKTRTSRWRPGTSTAYSNEGPPAAAYVIEKITGQRFEDYVAQTWFKPLRMETADFFYSPAVQRKLASLYHKDRVTPLPYWHISLRPAGSINASVRDMANFVQFYLNRGVFDGVRLLSANAIDRMERPSSNYAAREGMTVGYGLNNYCTVRGGRVWHGHSGGVLGGLTDLCYLPEAGVGYVFMINASSPSAMSKISDTLRSYLTRELAQPVVPPVPPMNPLVNSYEGWYEPSRGRIEEAAGFMRVLGLARVTKSGDRLTIKSLFGQEQEFVPVSDRIFRLAKEPLGRVALISDRSDGTFIQMEMSTLRRVPAWMAWLELFVASLGLLLASGSVIFALVWIPRKVFGRLKAVEHLSVRVYPLLAILSAAGGPLILVALDEDAFKYLGHASLPAVAICVLTCAFAGFAVLGLIQALRHFRSGNLWVWWHSFLLSFVLTVIAAYFAYWGLVGIRTWA